MTTVEFHSRADSDLPQPHNNNGSPRPKLVLPVSYLTVHYQGVPPFFYPRNDNDVRKHILRLQEIALASGKSFEYSYLIPPRTDVPQVWEYAGTYQAAHSAGENSFSVGVQFCNGVGQPLTSMQILAFRWLRAVMMMGEIIATNPVIASGDITRHSQMAGAATACPGFAIVDDWTRLLVPWIPPTPTPTPTTRYGDGMIVNLYPENTPTWAAVSVAGPHVTWLRNGDTLAGFKMAGVPVSTLPDDLQVQVWLEDSVTYGDPPSTLPQWAQDLWNARRAR